MSLEETIAANTAAVLALTAALQASAKSAPAVVTSTEPPKPARKAAAAPAAAPAEASKTASASTVTAKNVADALIEVVSKISRECGVEMLKKYNVPTASALKPEQYAEFVASCKTTLAQGSALAAPGNDLL